VGGFPVPGSNKKLQVGKKTHLKIFARVLMKKWVFCDFLNFCEFCKMPSFGIFFMIKKMMQPQQWSYSRSWSSVLREGLHFIQAGAFPTQTKLEFDISIRAKGLLIFNIRRSSRGTPCDTYLG
jgi:hypothetical protein